MFANQGDSRLDFGHHAHVAQQLLRASQILAHRVEQRQSALDVRVDVGLAMLYFGGVDGQPIDVIGQWRFDVVRFGLNAERGGRIREPLRRRGDLPRLDESDARPSVRRGEEPQEHFSVAIPTADDLLLPPVPGILVDELVEHVLDHRRQFRRRVAPLLGRGTIRMSGTDQVADPVFVAVDGKLVTHRQGPALIAQIAQLGLVEKGALLQRRAGRRGAQRDPIGAVVPERLARIDKIVPQALPRFGQSPLQMLRDRSPRGMVRGVTSGVHGRSPSLMICVRETSDGQPVAQPIVGPRLTQQLARQPDRHLQRVGPVVVIAHGEVHQLLDQ